MNKWFLAYKKRGKDLFNLSNLEIIETPDDIYYADPFLFEYKKKTYLFFEDFDHKKGVIACGILTDNGLTKIQRVLERPYHLSFPCVFRDGNEIYMIPETGGNQTLEIYRAVSFPSQWELFRTIRRDCIAGDTTISKHGNSWYLITTVHGDNNLEVWKTDSISEEWREHENRQLLYSRPAGNLFEYEGKLLRPVQDDSERYGYAVIFKEVQLEPSYQEKPYSRIDPTWTPGLIGTHTFNFTDKYVVVDGKIPL